MAINENVYGAANTWYDSDFQQPNLPNKNKTACFDSTQGVPWSSLGLGVEAGKLSWTEPIDKSLSYCGLGRESSFSTVCYYDNSGQIIDTNERAVTNFAFFEKSNDTPTLSDNTFFNTDYLEYFTWETANTLNRINFSRQLKPLTLVNPKNIVLSIFIRATTANLTGDIDVTLKNYLDNYKTTHTLIKDVYIKFWYGNIDEIGIRETLPFKYLDNRRPFMISILDEYDISSKNIKFNAYDIDSPSIFGIISLTNYIGVNDTTSFRIIYCTPTAKNHIVFRTVNDNVYGYIEYYPEFDEDIIKSVACFGLYFTPNDNICQLGALTNSDMYIGILDSDGIGHGQYLRGADTVNAPQNNYTDMSQSGYDYTKDVDKTKYKNDTEFYDSTIANGFTRFWVLDANGVSRVLNEMYDIMNDVDPDEPIERYSQKVFLTNNPIDCIISLKKFPVLHIPTLSGAYFVNFGSKATSISAYPLSKSCETYTFNFSAANDTSLYPVFGGDFRDFEPYTKCEIVIPFCGSVDVPCCYFYEYGGITVKLTIDFITGACTGFVLANGITISSVSGNCAIDLPVSGIQSATLDSQIFSAAQAKKQNFNKTRAGLVASALTATAGAITGNPVMIAAGAAGVLATAVNSKETVKNIDYELQHLQTPYKEVSTASGQISQSFDMRCKLIITRPKMLNYDENAYAETVGYACLNSGSVDSFHGLTYGTIELNGVPCTADEKSYIESMFANGVHLPTTYP